MRIRYALLRLRLHLMSQRRSRRLTQHRALQQLLDAIELDIQQGGYLIDWHACDLFPLSWIDLVIVLRSDSFVLYDRLKARGYSEKKLQENMDAEIMEVLLGEAREAFEEEIVIELQGNSPEDMETNVERIEAWIERWKMHNATDDRDGR